MKRNLRAQMVGFHHPCVFIQDHHNQDYYEFLHEADEFGAAAGTYPTEREELLANSAHRYQLLVDWTSQRLKLNVSFLNQGKIWFNFYADIAKHFGMGTQAYTTETRKPHIGISEITLQDAYLLQLILLHEMQHAIDFANYSGLHMSISERELRARISICEGVFALKASHEDLYANALQDVCYWFVLCFLTPGISMEKKSDYYDLLNIDTQTVLSSEGGGVLFSPLTIRSLTKELQRDKLSITSLERYAIDKEGGELKLKMVSLNSTDNPREPDNLEMLMIEDNHLMSGGRVPLQKIAKEDMGALTVDYSREVLTTRNQLTDWQSYDKTYEKLKEHAKVVIERDQPAFEEVSQRLQKEAGHLLERPLFAEVHKAAQPSPKPAPKPKTLADLHLPEAILSTDEADEQEKALGAVSVQLEPLRGGRARPNIEEELTLEDRMGDLSEFVKEKGGK
jgi:hypothetical protein